MRPSHKHHDHALNLFIVAARKGVLGGVSVSRQPSSALHYVFVLVIVNDLLYMYSNLLYIKFQYFILM